MVQYALMALVYLYTDVIRAKINVDSEHHYLRAAYILGSIIHPILASHVYVMNAISFDYGANMIFTGSFFGVQFASWLLWAVLMRTHRPKCARIIVAFQLLLLSAAAFEIFDFAPLGYLLDAHAVWHFLTIPLGFMWYAFLMRDAAMRTFSSTAPKSSLKEE